MSDQCRSRDIVFGIGPAGTGKTYLAVAMAVAAYKQKAVQKLILQDLPWKLGKV